MTIGRRSATVRGPGAMRGLAAARGLADLVLVVRPVEVLERLSAPASRPACRLVRLLGARVVLQQVLLLAVPTRRLALLGAAVDGLHATSMVGTALARSPYRRAAAVSAASAGACALLGLLTAPGPGTGSGG